MPDVNLASPSPVEIKRYEILTPLATGGMAEVLLARAKGLGGFEKLFVIKRIRRELAQNRDFARQILDEARIAATLQHSNIVQVFDVDTDGGTVFLVMEYLHGQDVRAITQRAWKARSERRPGFPIEHAVGITLGVCAGLHYAHEKVGSDGRPLSIVHRDVSPHNVLVTFDGGVKIIDFGIAKATGSLSATLFGMVKGKPGYMSPEQCRGEPLDRRSDLFCIGILLYEMTTGRAPYDAKNADEFFDGILNSDPVPPSRRVRSYPEELERIVLKALARDRAGRYQTAQEMQRDLEAFAQGERLHVTPFALAQFMERLFEEHSATWRLAQEQGASLAEHVVAMRTGQNAARMDTTSDSVATRLWRREDSTPAPPLGATFEAGDTEELPPVSAPSSRPAPPIAAPPASVRPPAAPGDEPARVQFPVADDIPLGPLPTHPRRGLVVGVVGSAAALGLVVSFLLTRPSPSTPSSQTPPAEATARASAVPEPEPTPLAPETAAAALAPADVPPPAIESAPPRVPLPARAGGGDPPRPGARQPRAPVAKPALPAKPAPAPAVPKTAPIDLDAPLPR